MASLKDIVDSISANQLLFTPLADAFLEASFPFCSNVLKRSNEVKMSDLSPGDIQKIVDSMTPEEIEFARIIDSGFKNMAKHVDQLLTKLHIVPSRRIELPGQNIFSEIVRHQGRPWTHERLNGSMVIAFSRQRASLVESTNPAVSDSVVDAMLASIIYAIVGQTDQNGVPIQGAQKHPDPVLECPERNDAYLFELGCYLLFLIDAWHISNKHHQARSKVFHGWIVALFVDLFEDSLEIKNLGPVLLNRFALYSEALRSGNNHAENTRSLFTELAKRCRTEAVPKSYDLMQGLPVLICDITVEYAICIDWASRITAMAESLCDMFSFAYSRQLH
jgi:hypothetical protein